MQTRAVHPARATGQPAQSAGRSGSGGDGDRVRGGKGGQARAEAAPKATQLLPSASKQPMGRRGESMDGSDYSERELSPDDLNDNY